MIKVLITGFKHSGTTLLHNLIKAHPQVGWIENEEGYIEYNKPVGWILEMAKKSPGDISTQVWGEKLPWGTRETDKKAARAIQFTKRWLRYFKKDARVIHIIRHPVDVSLSRYPFPIYKNKIFDAKILTQCIDTVPLYLSFIENKKKCATLVYEDLLINPQPHLENIFKFLKIDYSKKVIKKILKTSQPIDESRAFSFKNKGIKTNVNYDKTLERIKKRL